MTTLEVILLVSNAIWILAYMGARQLEQRWKASGQSALDQSRRLIDLLNEYRIMLRRVARSNHTMAGMLMKAFECLKKRDDEGEEWKR